MHVWSTVVTVVGEPSDQQQRVHYECVHCGRNLTAEYDSCPGCGSAVSEYEID